MERIVLLFISLLILTGCKQNDISFEDCLEENAKGDNACSSSELDTLITDMIDASSLLDEIEYDVNNAMLLNKDTLFLHIYINEDFSAHAFELFPSVLEFVRNNLKETSYDVEIIFVNHNPMIYHLSEENYLEVVMVMDILTNENSLSEDVQLEWFLTTESNINKRIRFGAILTGTDITIEDKVLVIDSTSYSEVDDFIDDLLEIYIEYSLRVN